MAHTTPPTLWTLSLLTTLALSSVACGDDETGGSNGSGGSGGSTGSGSGSAPAVCADVCSTQDACIADGFPAVLPEDTCDPECQSDILDDVLGTVDPSACKRTRLAVFECVAGLSCEEFVGPLDESSCVDELQALDCDAKASPASTDQSDPAQRTPI